MARPDSPLWSMHDTAVALASLASLCDPAIPMGVELEVCAEPHSFTTCKHCHSQLSSRSASASLLGARQKQ